MDEKSIRELALLAMGSLVKQGKTRCISNEIREEIKNLFKIDHTNWPGRGNK